MAVATTTILVAAAVAIAAASSAYAGVAASEQADAQADQAKAQAKLEEWQRQKAAKAAREQNASTLSKQRALLAASGQSGTTQSLALQEDSASTGAVNVQRINTDSRFAQQFLKARAAGYKQQGRDALIGGGLSAAASLAGGAARFGGSSGGGGATSLQASGVTADGGIDTQYAGFGAGY